MLWGQTAVDFAKPEVPRNRGRQTSCCFSVGPSDRFKLRSIATFNSIADVGMSSNAVVHPQPKEGELHTSTEELT